MAEQAGPPWDRFHEDEAPGKKGENIFPLILEVRSQEYTKMDKDSTWETKHQPISRMWRDSEFLSKTLTNLGQSRQRHLLTTLSIRVWFPRHDGKRELTAVSSLTSTCAPWHMHECAYTHTYAHAHTHACARIHTCTHMHTHACMHMHIIIIVNNNNKSFFPRQGFSMY